MATKKTKSSGKKGKRKYTAKDLSFNFGANVKKRPAGRLKNGASWS